MSRAGARPTRRASRLLARLRFLFLALFASCGPAGVVPTAAAPVCCPSPVVTWSAWSTYDRAHAAAIYVNGLTFDLPRITRFLGLEGKVHDWALKLVDPLAQVFACQFCYSAFSRARIC